MTKRIYYEFFYYHSIPEMLLWGVLLIGVWTVAALLFHRKGWSRAWTTGIGGKKSSAEKIRITIKGCM